MTQTPNFTGWKYYKFKGENAGICITHEDGKHESRTLDDAEVMAWLEEGNTPEPAEEQQ